MWEGCHAHSNGIQSCEKGIHVERSQGVGCLSSHGEDEVLMVEQGQRPSTGSLEPKQGEKDVPVGQQPRV